MTIIIIRIITTITMITIITSIIVTKGSRTGKENLLDLSAFLSDVA